MSSTVAGLMFPVGTLLFCPLLAISPRSCAASYSSAPRSLDKSPHGGCVNDGEKDDDEDEATGELVWRALSRLDGHASLGPSPYL